MSKCEKTPNHDVCRENSCEHWRDPWCDPWCDSWCVPLGDTLSDTLGDPRCEKKLYHNGCCKKEN